MILLSQKDGFARILSLQSYSLKYYSKLRVFTEILFLVFLFNRNDFALLSFSSNQNTLLSAETKSKPFSAFSSRALGSGERCRPLLGSGSSASPHRSLTCSSPSPSPFCSCRRRLSAHAVALRIGSGAGPRRSPTCSPLLPFFARAAAAPIISAPSTAAGAALSPSPPSALRPLRRGAPPPPRSNRRWIRRRR